MTMQGSLVARLERLIESGAFASQAKPELAESDAQQRDAHFASCLEPIARGILDLAKVNNDSLVDITACKTPVHTSIDPRDARDKFIAFNPQAPGCCMQPTGSSVFDPYRGLGLRAVILETGLGHRGRVTELSLVLPPWEATGRRVLRPGSIAIAKLRTTGFSSGAVLSPFIQTGEDGGHFPDADAFLRHLLGMEPIEGMVAMRIGRSIDEAIGFPGAKDYLAAQLPGLGDYFTDLAKKLGTPPHRRH